MEPTAKKESVYTVGCTMRTPGSLLALLQRYEVNCLVDVRKNKTENTGFEDDALVSLLKASGIFYLPFCDEFGEFESRPLDFCKKALFEEATKSERFQRGMKRLEHGIAKGFRIAIMGTAAHPTDCYRFTLIARYLRTQGIAVDHIMPSGLLFSHAELERSLPKSQQAAFLKPPTSRQRAEHNDLGKWGEDIAVAYLQEHGFCILERNWRYRHREIDIIAYHPDTQILSFVEVKTRRNNNFNEPELAVTRKKMWLLVVAANHYLRTQKHNFNAQFDIIAITGTPQTTYTLKYIPDAIPPSARTTWR